MIERILHDAVIDRMFKQKAIILIGARQVGKSTLFDAISRSLDEKPLHLNCDNPEVRQLLTDISTTDLNLLVAKHKVVMIDEAQRVDDIGLVIKRLVDNKPDLQVLATGSSSLNLRSKINEPLTGRKFEFEMFPISTEELLKTYGLIDTKGLLDFRLVYGSYPEILTDRDNARELLISLSDSYLYKDILELDSVRKPDLLRKILYALALQIGSEVSYNEVARTVGSDTKTVERYVDLLEKCFVLYRLNGLSRNLRNELKKNKKIYFYDTGIRNAIINNFLPVANRENMGDLWENFFIMERIKFNAYHRRHVNYYFWRTLSQQEIDFVEEADGKFTIFEMKWNPKLKNVKFPKAFLESYEVAEAHVVTPENYLSLLLS